MASVCANRSLSSSGFSIPYQRARAFPVSKGVSRRVQQDRASQWFPFSDASGTRPYLSTARCVTEEASFVASSRWRVKKIESDEELLVFLQIVLQGYFEGDHSRYVKSFMRKKLEQEMDRLKQKYQPRGDKMPETIAVEEDVGDAVGGGLEVCISERLSGICPEGVPVADKNGFYIQNVIVQPELRRQGIGNLLMRALIDMLQELNGAAVYAHVEAQNEEALALYTKHQFQIFKEVKELDPRANLGRLLLLKLEIPQKT